MDFTVPADQRPRYRTRKPALIPASHALPSRAPDITLPPAKQYFGNGIEILPSGTLLLSKFSNLGIPLVDNVEPLPSAVRPIVPAAFRSTRSLYW